MIIKADDAEKGYDGTPLTKAAYTFLNGTSLPSGYTLEVTMTTDSTITNVGTKDNEIASVVVRNGSGADVTGNYAITKKNGTLTVNARPIELTAGSKDKVYDGTALTDNSYRLTDGTLAAGQSIKTVKVSGSQTEVGSSPNVIGTGSGDVVIVDASDHDVTANYNITRKNGTLTVTSAPVTISHTVTYDPNGKAASDMPADETVEDGETATEPASSPTVAPKVTETDTKTITTTYTFVKWTTDREGENEYDFMMPVTENVVLYAQWSESVAEEDKPVTPIERTKEFKVSDYYGVYDAASHTVAVTNLMEGDIVEYSLDGETGWTTEAPTYINITNGAIPVYVRVGNASTVKPAGSRIRLLKAPGAGITYSDPVMATVTIVPIEVYIKAKDVSLQYGEVIPDTFELEAPPATLPGEEGQISYTLSTDATDDSPAGEYTIFLTANRIQGNYIVYTENGKLTIGEIDRNPADVTATGYSGEYDGDSHSVIVTGTLPEDLVEYSIDGGNTWSTEPPEETNVTDGAVVVDIRVTNPNTTPGVITKQVTIVITPKAVTVTANDKTIGYGEALPEFTATVTGTIGEDTIDYTISTTAVVGSVAGDYPVTPAGEERQGNYKVTYVPATLTITPAIRPGIKVTSYTGEYDGDKHTVMVDDNELLPGDVVEYSVDGGQTWTVEPPKVTDVTTGEDGRSEVRVRITNVNSDPQSTEAVLSFVKIIPRKVVVTAIDNSKVEGEKDPELTSKVEGLLDGDAISYQVGRAPGEEVGQYAITPEGGVNQGNYIVEYIPATFTITPKNDVTTPEETANDTEEDDSSDDFGEQAIAEEVVCKSPQTGEKSDEVPGLLFILLAAGGAALACVRKRRNK